MLAVSVMEAGCRGHVTNCRYLLLTNKMSTLIDLAARNMASHQPPSATKGAMDRSFSSPKTKEHHIPHANVCGPLFTLMAVVLGVVTQSDIDPITDQAIKDCIRYSSGSSLSCHSPFSLSSPVILSALVYLTRSASASSP